MLYSEILFKDIAWFDNKERAPGVLSNIISEDIGLMNGLSTETIAIIIEAFFTIVCGILIGMFFSWRVSLITLALLPLVMFGFAISNKLTAKTRGDAQAGSNDKNTLNTKEIDYYAESNALLSDMIMNYRTVISCGPRNMEYLILKYNKLLKFSRKEAVKLSH